MIIKLELWFLELAIPYNFFSDNSGYRVVASGAGLEMVNGAGYKVAIVTSGSGTVNHTQLYDIPSGASITSSGSIITVGGVTVTASALNGYKFAKWEVSPNNNTVTANTTITAVFEAIPEVKYTVSIGHSVIGGTVSQASVPNVVSGTSVTSSANYLYIGNVSVTAIASEGYEFSSWTGIPISGKITANTTIDAVFMPKNDDGGNGGGTYIVVPDINKEDKKEDKKDEPKAAEKFVDVDKNAFYYEAVNWAVEKGVTDGVDATHFAPNGITTRAQMVTFLWKAAGCPVVNYAMQFTDVPEGLYYTEAVRWAVSEGITNGTSATTFSPDANVSRAQTVAFIWRYEGSEVQTISNMFADVPSWRYYYNAILWAKANAITDGISADKFSPDASCTRGQIVTFLWRDMVD